MAKTLMIVDDNALFRSSLSMFLQAHGYEVLEAQNSAEGFELFDEHQPPLVITDIHMPEQNGVFFAREIMKKSEATKVFVITGLPNSKSFFDIAETFGAKRCFTKPLDLHEFCTAIDEEFFTGRETTVLERPPFLNEEEDELEDSSEESELQ